MRTRNDGRRGNKKEINIFKKGKENDNKGGRKCCILAFDPAKNAIPR